MSETDVYTPSSDAWDHSHTSICELRNLHNADGEFGNRLARVEVVPRDNLSRFRNDNNLVRDDVCDEHWQVILDEQREPGWWAEDRERHKDRALRAAARWLKNCNHCLVPGYRAMGGDGCVLTGGNNSTLTGGNYSTLTGGDDSTLTGGYKSILTGGDNSTLTGGNGSTLTGGYGSTLTGGNGSTLTGGYGSTLTGGDSSTLTGGNGSTLTGGYGSILTGGNYSTLTCGDESTLTGGNGSTLTGGNSSTLTGRYRSILTGGYNSTLCWRIWNYNKQRYDIHTRYVGEDGIEPNVAYVYRDGVIKNA